MHSALGREAMALVGQGEAMIKNRRNAYRITETGQSGIVLQRSSVAERASPRGT